ncbi:ABC transporter permease [Proteiniphilum sp.]|uniref:ABC transporter permease n=1 Tax=Proteiniphilum sp. TaxID=1926877 RepID=UPI002B1EA1F2|nr:ABC transporter permease [Proteiniphilum sp.]MEA4917593.1 ABC transporter permease [Proteiniphilum sp.]
MIHHIFKQIWAQRRYNGWIFIELMVVFVLVWVLTDYAFVMLHNKSIPQGFDISDTYLVTYGIYGDETSRYNPAESDSVKIMENLDLFVRKIKAYKNVEYADLSYLAWGSIPFSGGQNRTSVTKENDDFSVVFAETKYVSSGDFFRIFRYTSTKDASWERPASIDLYQNNSILITRKVEWELFKNESAIGKTVTADIGDGAKKYVVADVLNDQKRFDYRLPEGAVFGGSPLVSPDNLTGFGVCLRVKQGIPEKQFILDFRKEMTKQLHIGNFYLKNIESFLQRKENLRYELGITNEVRTRTALMIFFLLNIGLGIIATFWFRNETRLGEIGLRMAMGSPRTTLQRQFITEAILLFTLAVIPALIINYVIARSGMIELNIDLHRKYETVPGSPYITQHFTWRFLIANLMTYLLLVMIILFSAWLPAYKAAKVHPVEALRDE